MRLTNAQNTRIKSVNAQKNQLQRKNVHNRIYKNVLIQYAEKAWSRMIIVLMH